MSGMSSPMKIERKVSTLVGRFLIFKSFLNIDFAVTMCYRVDPKSNYCEIYFWLSS